MDNDIGLERLLKVVKAPPRVWPDDPRDYPEDPHFYPYQIQPKRRFVRHWQIEWEGCQHAARGWTRRACWRRGARWRDWDGGGRRFGLTWIEWHAERGLWRLRNWHRARSAQTEEA